MPDERTPIMQKAHEVWAGWQEEKARRKEKGYGSLFPTLKEEFAAALIERDTPVEILDDGKWGRCACKVDIRTEFENPRYCPNCGRPITWTWK